VADAFNPPPDVYQTIVRSEDGKLYDVTLPIKGMKLIRDETGAQRLVPERVKTQ